MFKADISLSKSLQNLYFRAATFKMYARPFFLTTVCLYLFTLPFNYEKNTQTHSDIFQ